MRLILVRHGRPDEGDLDSPNDPPLNARRLAAGAGRGELAGERTHYAHRRQPIAARASRQRTPLAERLGLLIDTVDGWAEADRRATRYRSTETLRAEGGEAWARFLHDPIRYLGAEPDAFRAGVLAALRETASSENRASRVVVFTHGLPINVVLSHALGLASITHFLVAYGSVTRLRRRDDGGYGVSSVNETGHHRVPADE